MLFTRLSVRPRKSQFTSQNILNIFPPSTLRQIRPSTPVISAMKSGSRRFLWKPTAPTTDWNQHDEFFIFTRARFIRDEEFEMDQRHVRFDMNELARLSAKAVGSNYCVQIEKYPDGMFSKAYLMTMDDGVDVVAKVPNPNAGRPHFTTASEVATMDFVRNICGTPVPKVFAWSSKAEENSLGAEYIIIERLKGVQLSTVWKSLEIDEKSEIVQQLAAYQASWMATRFKQYGSLYYAQDVPKQRDQPAFSYINKNGDEITDDRFAIGSTVHRQSIDYGRVRVDFNRGPWNTVEEYCEAIGNREMECVKVIQPLPKPPLTIAGRYIPTREKKLAALQSYMKLIKFLLPTDPSITTSHIWHTDLHDENIFVNPENPTAVIGIIDWQAVSLGPLFELSPRPALLDYDGPPLDGINRPEEPKDLAQLEPKQRAIAFDNYMDMTLASYYQNLIYYTNKRLYRVIEFRETICHDLLSYARNILIDGEAVFQGRVCTDLQQAWPTLPQVQAFQNPPYPFTFSEDNMAAIARDYDGMSDGITCMMQMQAEMGHLFPGDRSVPHEEYEETKGILSAYKKKVLEEFAREEKERAAVMAWWPFD